MPLILLPYFSTGQTWILHYGVLFSFLFFHSRFLTPTLDEHTHSHHWVAESFFGNLPVFQDGSLYKQRLDVIVSQLLRSVTVHHMFFERELFDDLNEILSWMGGCSPVFRRLFPSTSAHSLEHTLNLLEEHSYLSFSRKFNVSFHSDGLCAVCQRIAPHLFTCSLEIHLLFLTRILHLAFLCRPLSPHTCLPRLSSRWRGHPRFSRFITQCTT